MLETLDYTIRIGSTPSFLYFDLYLYSTYATRFFVYESLFAHRGLFRSNVTYVYSIGLFNQSGALNIPPAHLVHVIQFDSSVAKIYIIRPKPGPVVFRSPLRIVKEKLTGNIS